MVAFPYSAIGVLRESASSTMVDCATITRPTAGALDASTGLVTVADTPPLWTGRCRIGPRGNASRDTEVGDAHTTLGQYEAVLPLDANDFAVGDYLTVTSSPEHPFLVGVPMEIVDVPRATWMVARRLHLQTAQWPKP